MASRYLGILYLFFVSFIGIIFGTIYIQMFPHSLISDLLEQWSSIINQAISFEPSVSTFTSYFVYQISFFIYIFIFGLTIIGYPIALLIHFLKAFLIGSTFQLFFTIWGDDALLYITVWMVPSGIFILLALLVLTQAVGVYSIDIYKSVKDKKWNSPLRKLSRSALIALCFVVIASLAHTYVSPLLLQFIFN